MRKANRPLPMLPGSARLQARLFKWRKRFSLVVAIVLFLAGDAALWTFGAPAFATAMLRALIAGETPMIATAASFSVSAGSFATQDRATAFAAALDASGLPILVRARPQDGRFQVLVGPYVSIDEAEHAQRGLAAWGLGEARLVVDDTMRSRPQRAGIFGAGDEDSDGVLMVAAAGMSSIVFEMRHAPRQVEARRTSARTLDIVIGDVASTGEANSLTLPEGVVLVKEVSVASAPASGAMRARLVVPEEVQSRLRLEGRRVYVDLGWPKAPWQVGNVTPGPKGPGLRNVARVGSDPASRAAAYRDQLHVAVERFQEIKPFLLSAVESPEPDVLAALARTLEGVRESLKGATPTSDLIAQHQLLMASVTLATHAVVPSFTGDRAATVRQAIAMFDSATK